MSERWIALTEKRPTRGQTVLAFWPGAESAYLPRSFAVVTYSGTGRWHHPDDDEDDYAEPSHWMPLPVPPKSESSTGSGSK